MSGDKKRATVAIQSSIKTGHRQPIAYFDSRQYIQHNLSLGDGLDPLLAFLDSLQKDQVKVNVVRSFEDGEFSFAHAAYVLGDWGPMTGFEIHRWHEGRIVEHWDNLQSTPGTRNLSDRSLIDGPTAVLDLDKTSSNKAVAITFTDEILLAQKMEAIGAFFNDWKLQQHNHGLRDGILNWVEREEDRQPFGAVRYKKRHLVMGEGNFVLVACEGELLGGTLDKVALYDLYRLEKGKIVEHWDVIEKIIPRAEWKNSNGKF